MATGISRQDLDDHAFEAGFDTIGVTSPDKVEAAGLRFREYLELGRHGDMAWMEAKADRRADPRTLWPEVKSIIMLGMNYGPPVDPLSVATDPATGNISVYARNRDYHDLVKKRLKQVARWLHGATGDEVKVFVDTAPVLEKPLAAAAGMGWQGKHSNLVNREVGSWLFIGSIFTTHQFAADAPEEDHCGSCQNCLDICPTKAFPAPYQVDARRCISYLTIETKDIVPEEFRTAIGNRIYGCDDCLAVCPWNKYARASAQAQLLPREDLVAPKLAELAKFDDAGFRTHFSGNPIKRIGRNKFISNVLIAIGNSGVPELTSVAQNATHDDSPLVREAAQWALKQLITSPSPSGRGSG